MIRINKPVAKFQMPAFLTCRTLGCCRFPWGSFLLTKIRLFYKGHKQNKKAIAVTAFVVPTFPAFCLLM